MGRPRTCSCDECRKCRHREYMRQWYARPENTDRARETARRSRRRRLEAVRAYDRARGFRVYDENKVRARKAVATAILRGDLVPHSCEVCGDEQVQAHHDDYARPLVVRFLCRRHHMELHRTVAA